MTDANGGEAIVRAAYDLVGPMRTGLRVGQFRMVHPFHVPDVLPVGRYSLRFPRGRVWQRYLLTVNAKRDARIERLPAAGA